MYAAVGLSGGYLVPGVQFNAYELARAEEHPVGQTAGLDRPSQPQDDFLAVGELDPAAPALSWRAGDVPQRRPCPLGRRRRHRADCLFGDVAVTGELRRSRAPVTVIIQDHIDRELGI